MKRKKKSRKIFVLFLILILGGLIFYYFNGGKEVLEKQIPKKQEIKKLKIVNEDSDERNIAVMINNHSAANPHSGLDDAYLVYEIIVEGGLTRMMAVYKDKNTDIIGSVRSARHYFLDYALENDAIYTHFGWSEKAESDIQSLGINNINGLYDDAFWREKLNLAYEHTAFTSIDKVKELAKKKKYRLTSDDELLLNYSVDEINLNNEENATVANEVSIPYSYQHTTSYVYNPDTKRYLRYMNGIEHTDRITNNQYSTKNIIIAKIKNYSIDSYGRQNLDNIGTGEGYYITNGYSIPITWSKSSRNSKTIYKKFNGEEIKVNDGNTYIQIEPINFEPNFS